MIVKSYRPDHRVTVRRWEDGELLPERDISGDVLSIQTAKSYGNAAGGFVVTGTWNLESRLALSPHDMVKIEFDAGDGQGFRVDMVGLLTRYARVLETDQTGKPHRVARLTGLDLGRIPHVHQIGGDLALLDRNFGDEKAERLRGDIPVQFSGTPAEMVRNILDRFLYAEVPWTSSWILADRLSTDDDWQTLDFSLLTLQGGSLWDALRRVANMPWNTLHGDTGADGKYHLVLERTPFDVETGRLTRSTFHTVSGEDAKSYDLGVDDSERVNWFFLNPKLMIFADPQNDLALLMARQGMPRYSQTSMQAYGFRPLQIETEFTPFGKRRLENAEGNDLTEIQARGEAMWNWHKDAATYENGTLTVKGNPKYRAGDGVLWEGKEFLIEKASHHYSWGGVFFTSLELTRGQKHET